MAVISETLAFTSTGHLRPLDAQRDLLAVADLIELCFASTMDADGEQYLRQMRRAARDISLFRWSPGAMERVSMPLSGFVWEENGRLVGNLSLIPLSRMGKKTYFIANVAVHPDFRRRGIARALTEAALNHIRRRRVSTAWLQVRQDNPNAFNLYHSEGFVEKARRTTWRAAISKRTDYPPPVGDIIITNRTKADWLQQKTWLEDNYPPEIAWNLPFHANNLRPSLAGDFFRFLSGTFIRHWAARQKGQLLGTLSFEPTTTASDNFWLAASPASEALAILSLLPYALGKNSYRGSLSINYPAGRAQQAFIDAGFSEHQTLIWMEARGL